MQQTQIIRLIPYFFDEPNHYETDIELNEHYEKVVNSTFGMRSEKRYKDHSEKNDCYVTYMGAFEGSKSYEIFF